MNNFIAGLWEKEILPSLCDYIRIPNLSPMFDPDWETHGHMEAAVALFEAWATEKIKKFPGASLDVLRVSGRTPLIVIDIPGKTSGTVLFYGHLDKQPEGEGWSNGLSPWMPVIKDDKLYGRGSIDDGYAMFTVLSALLALEAQNLPHARCVILIEASEESGSRDIPFYLDRLKERIGALDLAICLDSRCGTYDRMWLTTSLRGAVVGILKVRVLDEGAHSGHASGIVPSSFRILRMLLSRIEDEATGLIKLKDAFSEIPAERLEEVNATAGILGDAVVSEFSFAGNTKPMAETSVEMILNKGWRPQLAVTGIDGYPKTQNAGNVLLPFSAAKLSLRTPPGCDAAALAQTIKQTLEKAPPYDAEVTFDITSKQSGWNAPPCQPWLKTALNRASLAYFGNPTAFLSQGASISFVGLMNKIFPQAQFIVTGVSGPGANPHGPDEFLHIPSAKKLSACLAEILVSHALSRR